MKIGKIEVGRVTLAPMAGYGDIAFRRLARDYGASLTTTEMVSAKGLVYENEKTVELLRLADNEKPSCVQLFGGEPEFFAKAIAMSALDKFDIIDINMGCPVGKVTKNGEGSALMRDHVRAGKIVEAAVKAAKNRPVTVKFRLGWDEEHICAVEFGRVMQNSGAAAVTTHGRTTSQLYRGRANWDEISLVAAALDIPVIGNGDISSCSECDYRLSTSGCAGVAIGRGALGHPEIFREVAGGSADILLDVILRHINYMLEYFPSYVVARAIRKHLAYYLHGVTGVKQLKGELNEITDIDVLREKLTAALQPPEYTDSEKVEN